jgi:hypothetical protein
MNWEYHYIKVAGHFGMEKIVVLLQNYLYWPKLQEYARKYIRSCISCIIAKPVIKKQGIYIPMPNPDIPWESISINDMYVLPSTKNGNDRVCMDIDRFSKMPFLTPYKKSITTKAIEDERVYVHFRIPKTIILDHDSRFLTTLWSNLWSLMGTKLTKSTSFYPQTNGLTKVVNMMIVHILRMYNSKNPCTWHESLPYVFHNYNKAIHSSTDHIPFYVGLGFQPLGLIDVALPLETTQT